jgi:hypothetical protein
VLGCATIQPNHGELKPTASLHRRTMALDEPAGLRGSMLSRIDDRELPLDSITFDGSELRLRMSVASIGPNREPPYLVMRAVADDFVGGWDTPEVKGILLKLIRARAASDGA